MRQPPGPKSWSKSTFNRGLAQRWFARNTSPLGREPLELAAQRYVNPSSVTALAPPTTAHALDR
jgi:hypothetical protein